MLTLRELCNLINISENELTERRKSSGISDTGEVIDFGAFLVDYNEPTDSIEVIYYPSEDGRAIPKEQFFRRSEELNTLLSKFIPTELDNWLDNIKLEELVEGDM